MTADGCEQHALAGGVGRRFGLQRSGRRRLFDRRTPGDERGGHESRQRSARFVLLCTTFGLALYPGLASFNRSVEVMIGLAALAVFSYALLFEWLGFTLATALMAVPVGMAFGGNWKQSLAGGVGLGLVLFFLFDKLLDVVLPSGLLSVLLGGR